MPQKTRAGARSANALHVVAAHRELLPLTQCSGFSLSTLLALERAIYLADERSMVSHWLFQQELPTARQILQRIFYENPSSIAANLVTGRTSKVELMIPTKDGRFVLQLRLVWCKRRGWFGRTTPVARIRMQCHVQSNTHECAFEQELHVDHSKGLKVRKRQTRLRPRQQELILELGAGRAIYL